MLDIDQDRYYTPIDMVCEVLGTNMNRVPTVCVDTSCGTGNLLRAAQTCFTNVKCVGVDSDAKVIQTLRRTEPRWILSVGDMLNPKSYNQTKAVSTNRVCDMLLLNPPFSHNNVKHVKTNFHDTKTRASTAMAHLLKGLELFSPKSGAFVVVPESMLYSTTDSNARSLIESRYDIEQILELNESTFQSTRARAVFVRLSPLCSEKQSVQSKLIKPLIANVNIVRGALSVHNTTLSKTGSPFLHSTDLKYITNTNGLYQLKKTKQEAKGKTRGWAILIPRVGLPKLKYLRLLHLDMVLQLSDCVISLEFDSRSQGRIALIVIKDNWVEFEKIYRGTGARYITINRLRQWLKNKGINSVENT